jgi:hypothetical protein
MSRVCGRTGLVMPGERKSVERDEIDETNPSPYRSPTHRVVAWSLEDASELQVRREKDAAIEQEKHDRAELANVPATHGFALKAFVAALLRASSKKSSGPAPSGEHVNRDAAKGLRGAGFKVDAGDVRRIRQLIERYNPEILPAELRPAPLALPPVALSLPNNVVRLRGSED